MNKSTKSKASFKGLVNPTVVLPDTAKVVAPQTVAQAVTALDTRINPNFTAPKGRSYSNDTITLVKTSGHLAPQAAKIIEALVKAPNYTLTVEQLLGEGVMYKGSALMAVGIKTTQPLAKIWTHYRNQLEAQGFITLA